MRIVGYIDHPVFKISVFSWSEKYIVKIEAGFFEQSYKFRFADFNNWTDLKELFDKEFLEAIHKTFELMSAQALLAAKRFQTRPGFA
jgi:hypothetical protein